MTTEIPDRPGPTLTSLYATTTFDEFWQCYRALHADRRVQVAHAIATASAAVLLAAAIVLRAPALAIAAPIVDFAIAQSSHRATGTRTKPYRRPLWHLRAELRLFRCTLAR
jgi:hypothetical protein